MEQTGFELKKFVMPLDAEVAAKLGFPKEKTVSVPFLLQLVAPEAACASYRLSLEHASVTSTDRQQFPIDAHCLDSASYIGYKDDIDDYGWGCAWRAIQMVLSSYFHRQSATHGILQAPPTFAYLFYNFGNKDVLCELYRRKHALAEAPRALVESRFAPHDQSNGWAEPLVCHCVLQYYGIASRLVLVNDGSITMNGPRDAYSGTLTFREFARELKTHFQNNDIPVMFDDGLFAKCIIAYGEAPDGCHSLLIADPHILDNTSNREIGVYFVLLDADGRLIVKSESETRYCLYFAEGKTVEANSFFGKTYMVCFPELPRLQQ